MELWDVYNSTRDKVGKTAVRGEGLEGGEYHVVVRIWPVNDDRDFLIQKRAACVEADMSKARLAFTVFVSARGLKRL